MMYVFVMWRALELNWFEPEPAWKEQIGISAGAEHVQYP